MLVAKREGRIRRKLGHHIASTDNPHGGLDEEFRATSRVRQPTDRISDYDGPPGRPSARDWTAP